MDRFLETADLEKALREDVIAGLTGVPKTLPPKWFYDERGSELFEQITALDEYYPTRRERAILIARAEQIAALTGAQTLVELGAGSGEKTRLLLDALSSVPKAFKTYVPVDVSGDFLAEASAKLAAEYPALDVRPVVADFGSQLGLLPTGPRKLVAFLGGTIGNLDPAERALFFASVRSILGPDDAFLLGADLVKDAGRLVRAYDDAAGVTAQFNKNVLKVINLRLDANFDLDCFEHVAVWDAENEWIEMRLRSRARQEVRIEALKMTVRFADTEELRTEISAKFRRDGLAEELASAGLGLSEFWTDPEGDFSLSLAHPL
jgi:L-histidine Nalpha-methyltransferase